MSSTSRDAQLAQFWILTRRMYRQKLGDVAHGNASSIS